MKSELGPELRLAREHKRLSLRSVAAGIGVSPSLLSQVETGKTQPSVSTLYALVSYLGVSIDDLMGTGTTASESPGEPASVRSAPRSPIQRHEDNPVIEMENGVTWERLAIDENGTVDPLIVTYQPGGSSSIEGRMMRHNGLEFGYVLSGELTVLLDFDRYILKPGDSVCFDSTKPHLFINHTAGITKCVWFVVGRKDVAVEAPAIGAGSWGPGQNITNAVDMLQALGSIDEPKPGGQAERTGTAG